jgi:hypothetical protein
MHADKRIEVMFSSAFIGVRLRFQIEFSLPLGVLGVLGG